MTNNVSCSEDAYNFTFTRSKEILTISKRDGSMSWFRNGEKLISLTPPFFGHMEISAMAKIFADFVDGLHRPSLGLTQATEGRRLMVNKLTIAKKDLNESLDRMITDLTKLGDDKIADNLRKTKAILNSSEI